MDPFLETNPIFHELHTQILAESQARLQPQLRHYLAYVAQATPTGWNHLVYAWGLRDPLPSIPIPLLGGDYVSLELEACFRSAYDRIGADDEADYGALPPPPGLRPEDRAWIDEVLRQAGVHS